uniref:Protein krueppel n=1 Tax=Glossina palpalis gambiensis TaxID=67801 RepID=A0A1B0C2Y1_9MUSC
MKSGLNEKWLVCRICLQQPKETMQTIFDQNSEKDLTQMILECGGVPIKQFDHYPDKICSKCYKYLQVAFKFRTTCQRSHKQLSRFIAPVVVDKLEDDEQEEVCEDEIDLASSFDETLIVDESDDVLIKFENQIEENNASSKEEYTVHVEEDFDEFVEIYEPMTEEEEQVFELTDEDPQCNMKTEQNEDLEYLETEEDLELPSSDEEYIQMEAKKDDKSQATTKKNSSHASTSQTATKRVKREPKEKRSKESQYICDFCGNKYQSQGRLTEHIKLHKGIKPHECEICGHAFAQTQQLARHMNTHTGNRPYKCNYCPAAFADLSTRNKHHRIHTNERPYVCDVCGKSFTYTNTLKFHKMIHTGEKPFVCDICGKGFQQAYKLRTHKMIHEKKGIKREIIEAEHNQTQNLQDIPIEAMEAQILNM